MSSLQHIIKNKYIKKAGIIKNNYKKAHKTKHINYYKGASIKYKSKDKNYSTFLNMEPTLQGL